MARNGTLQQCRAAAFARFAELGFEKVRAWVRNRYDEGIDIQYAEFAIEWLNQDPEAIATVNVKCDAIGYERVQAMVDGFSKTDELFEDEEAACCRWLLEHEPDFHARRARTIEADAAESDDAKSESDDVESDDVEPETETDSAKDLPPKLESSKLQNQLERFVAYMPLHNYIYTLTREPWPGASVNSQIPPLKLFYKGKPLLNDKGKQVFMAANVWLDKYRPVQQMTWAPGEEMIIKNKLVADGGWFEHQGARCFNLYKPPTIVPGDADDVKPWLDHISKIYPTDAQHILNWLAHRVQHPQDKINHGLVLGGLQGIGKDTILEPVKRAVGSWNFQEVSPTALVGTFNGFLKAVILRINEARDLGEVNRFQFYEHTKPMLTAPPDVHRVNEKNLREHYVFNVCGVIITTNYKTDGIYLPADDRRHYVAWSDLTKESFDKDYWNNIWKWYDNGGDRNVAAYLATRDISSFDPKAPPPKTEAFWAIVNSNRATEESELADVFDEIGNPDAVTIEQIIETASPYADLHEWICDRRNRRAIPHRLEQCGYVPVRNTTQKQGLWIINGKRYAIYAKSELSISLQIKAATELQKQADAKAKEDKTVWEKEAERVKANKRRK
jgi:hypothetical protein